MTYEQLLTRLLANATELAWMPPLLLTRATARGSDRGGRERARRIDDVPKRHPRALRLARSDGRGPARRARRVDRSQFCGRPSRPSTASAGGGCLLRQGDVHRPHRRRPAQLSPVELPMCAAASCARAPLPLRRRRWPMCRASIRKRRRSFGSSRSPRRFRRRHRVRAERRACRRGALRGRPHRAAPPRGGSRALWDLMYADAPGEALASLSGALPVDDRRPPREPAARRRRTRPFMPRFRRPVSTASWSRLEDRRRGGVSVALDVVDELAVGSFEHLVLDCTG